jgi:hypothetical protein
VSELNATLENYKAKVAALEDELKQKENEFERKFNTQDQLHLDEIEKVKETHLKEMEALNIENQ